MRTPPFEAFNKLYTFDAIDMIEDLLTNWITNGGKDELKRMINTNVNRPQTEKFQTKHVNNKKKRKYGAYQDKDQSTNRSTQKTKYNNSWKIRNSSWDDENESGYGNTHHVRNVKNEQHVSWDDENDSGYINTHQIRKLNHDNAHLTKIKSDAHNRDDYKDYASICFNYKGTNHSTLECRFDWKESTTRLHKATKNKQVRKTMVYHTLGGLSSGEQSFTYGKDNFKEPKDVQTVETSAD